MCREGRRHSGETQSTSREQSSSQRNSPCQETQNNTCCCSSLALGQSLFYLHFLSPFVSLCSWLVLADILPLADQDCTLGALPSNWISGQNGSAVFYCGRAFRGHIQARNARNVHEPGKKEIQ